ncbi:uncharacterized protein LOC121982918 [Zingiber officinale]|uniref:uncharacterized protein LOC121982918 n=1 Tax=Zingiber officinale TaxID=94328 RepID=UPI001C4AF570|nr:uncharacterized protein LOC121982918 [Zingiber officinale]
MASTSNQELAFTYSQQGIPIFVGQDFELWNVLMRTVFVSHELWDVIDEGYIAHTPEEVAAFTNAQKKEHKENKTKDAKALSFMHQGVSRSILPRITSAKTAKEAWQILKNQFGGHEKDSENVQDFLSRVLTVINQIRGYGDTLEEKKIIEKVLRCLPAKFEHIVAAIEESKDLSKLSLDELMGSLEAHEKRMNRFSTQTLEQAFQGKMNVSQKEKDSPQEKKNISAQRASQGRGRGRFQNSNTRGQGRGGRGNSSSRFKNQDSDSYCRICRRNGHDTQSCWNRCKRCRNANHSKKDCWFQDEDETKEANFSEKNEADQVFYSCLNSQQQLENIWYVDSGCSNHMSGNKKMFVDIDESFSSEVKIGDGKALKIIGKSAVSIQTKEGKDNIIKDVLYVPELTQNLLSVGQLLQKNYKVEFNNDHCVIIDKQKKLTMARIKMSQNKVFPLNLPLAEKVALQSMTDGDHKIWHLRSWRRIYWKCLHGLLQREGDPKALAVRYSPQQNGVAESNARLTNAIAYY